MSFSVEPLDIADPAALASAGLHPRTCKNIDLFSSFSPDLSDNLSRPAISPITGAFVTPANHFGIDSDPWMHAILYSDGVASFIIICRGMTETCVLGSVYLIDRKTLIEHRNVWYFRDVYESVIGRNLPRMTEYFALKPRLEICGPGRPLLAAIGNRRVGDFIMQLAWVEELLSLLGKGFSLDRLFVNIASEFIDVSMVFPELAPVIERQESGVHIEYRARDCPGMLLSDVRSLAHRAVADRLRARFRRIAEAYAVITPVAGELADLDRCPLIVWISIELEKRVWSEQLEGLPALLAALAEIHLEPGEPLGIVHNGFTGTETGDMPDVEKVAAIEIEVFEEMLTRLDWPHVAVSAAGRSLGPKSALAARCDLVVAPIGSASILPSMLFDVPGILYGPKAISRAGFVGSNTLVLPDEAVTELPKHRANPRWTSSSSVSYSMDWRDAFALLKAGYTAERNVRGRICFAKRARP